MTTLQTDREGSIIIVRSPQVRDRISRRAPIEHIHDGRGVWRLGRCRRGGDGCAALLGPQLAATPLATIAPEAFVDFTTIRPVVRLSAAGERTIRWPRIALWTWQPPEGGAGLLRWRGVEPQLRWRTYATLLLDVAARWGAAHRVAGRGPRGRAAYPAPAGHGQQH
jgi:hypothetical protein